MATRPLPARPDRDQHVLTIALSAHLGAHGGQRPLSPARYWAAYDQLAGDLTAAGASEDEQLRQLEKRTTAAALHAAELEGQGIALLTPFHASYPARFLDRLGTACPPLLYVAGGADLLADPDRRRLAVVGSRDATDGELDTAGRAARAAVARGWDVVSGGARGVDAVALNAAIEHGGTVAALLTDGVRRALRKGALRRLVSDGRAVLASGVHPDAGFSVGNAMARNKLIYALADLTYVAAVVEGEGGTWGGAQEALRRGFGRVAVNPEARAAGALQALGARPVAAPDELLAVVEEVPDATAEPSSDDAPGQTRLFD